MDEIGGRSARRHCSGLGLVNCLSSGNKVEVVFHSSRQSSHCQYTVTERGFSPASCREGLLSLEDRRSSYVTRRRLELFLRGGLANTRLQTLEPNASEERWLFQIRFFFFLSFLPRVLTSSYGKSHLNCKRPQYLTPPSVH